MDSDPQSLAPLVLRQEHHEALRTTDLQGIQDMVYLSHACPGSYQPAESTTVRGLDTPIL